MGSALVEVERLRTLDRLRGHLPDDELATRRDAMFELLRRFEIVEAGQPVLARAALPLPTALGTLDAIHLATASLWREQQGWRSRWRLTRRRWPRPRERRALA